VKRSSGRHHWLDTCSTETTTKTGRSSTEDFDSLNVAVAATKKLSITADDQISELYVDGVSLKVPAGDWKSVRVFDIPSDTKVIAVKALDIAQVSSSNEMRA
jgi:hypothetical protein